MQNKTQKGNESVSFTADNKIVIRAESVLLPILTLGHCYLILGLGNEGRKRTWTFTAYSLLMDLLFEKEEPLDITCHNIYGGQKFKVSKCKILFLQD